MSAPATTKASPTWVRAADAAKLIGSTSYWIMNRALAGEVRFRPRGELPPLYHTGDVLELKRKRGYRDESGRAVYLRKERS